MSAVVEIRYISGRAHGTPWGASHNEGRIEFPPSPWRIARALLSAWFERAPEIEEEIVRSLLEKLSAVHPVYSVPPFAGAHVRHYLPESSHKAGVSTATAKVLDAFAAVDPSTPLVITWNVELTPDERASLAVLVERIPYVGRAESLVTACLVDAGVAGSIGTDCRQLEARDPEPSDGAVARLLCSERPFDWSAALEVPWRVRQKGFVDPPSTRRVVFVSREPLEWNTTSTQPRMNSAVVRAIEWKLRGKGRIPLTAAVAYCDVLRKAIIKKACDANVPRDWRLLGRDGGDPTDRHHLHSHFLPIEDTEHPGFLGGLLVWTPAGLDEGTTDAALSVTNLWAGGADGEARQGLRDFRPVRLFVQQYGDPIVQREDWQHLKLFGESAVWESITPYAPARHVRSDQRMQRSLEHEVSRELVEREMPAPVEVVVLPGSGGGRSHPLQFRRHRVNENLAEGRRAFHLRIRFESAVRGPIAIGALSHFGLGTFAPASG